MHPSLLLLLISVPWMILDRVSSSPVPPSELQIDENKVPDIRDVELCTGPSKRVCYTFETRGEESETRARREVNPQDSQDQDEDDTLEQLRYAKEREQELLDLEMEQEALARKA